MSGFVGDRGRAARQLVSRWAANSSEKSVEAADAKAGRTEGGESALKFVRVFVYEPNQKPSAPGGLAQSGGPVSDSTGRG
ncbi:MAG: hypothetical protein ACRDG3_11215 [Tepidiformaceae bacterium]